MVPLPETGRLLLLQGNPVQVSADALVNAANTSLQGGGGVDGALHRAAGPGLLDACRRVGRCPPGEARITGAGRLPARHVIHTVGPLWQEGDPGERELLARCYRAVFALVEEQGPRTVAFPSISTGTYRFPIEEAAPIALRELRAALGRLPGLERVTVVLFARRGPGGLCPGARRPRLTRRMRGSGCWRSPGVESGAIQRFPILETVPWPTRSPV